MNKEKIESLISKVAEKYNGCFSTLSPLYKFKEDLKNEEDLKIFNLIFDYIKEKNQRPSTFIYNINGFHKKNLLDCVSRKLC